MWPLRIENPIFLLKIYGNCPDLSSVEVSRIVMERDGPSMHLSFVSTILPYRPPAKWGEFNSVYFDLQFIAVQTVSLRQFGHGGTSSIRMWDDGADILLTCEGAVRLSLTCKWLRIYKISGLLRNSR